MKGIPEGAGWDIPTGDDVWRNNPYIPGSHNLKDLLNYDSMMKSMRFADERLKAIAYTLRPEEVAMISKWAKHHPSADPRMWMPLAQYGIDPASPEGASAVMEDQKASVLNGTYGTTAGTHGSDLTTPPVTTPPEQPADDADEGGGWLSGLWKAATGPLDDVGGAISGLAFGSWNDSGSVASPVAHTQGFTNYATSAEAGGGYTRFAVRNTLTLLNSPIQALVAGPRNVLGTQNRRNQLQDLAADRWDLSPDTNELMTVNARFWEDAKFDPESIPGGPEELERAKQASAWVDKKMSKYQAEQPNILEQTDAGQVAISATDDKPGNLLWQRPVQGSVYDPKTKAWLNPETGKPADWEGNDGLLPSPEAAVQNLWAATKAYDMRTLEEKAKGVLPVAWTPGRGLAHQWYSPDEGAFAVMSGIGDAFVNLFGDPINLIPAGGIGKIGKSYTTLGKALEGAGDSVVVLTRGARRAGDVTKASPAALVREGARGEAAKKAIADDVDVALDPYLDEKGFEINPQGAGVAPKVSRFGDETGRVDTPHARFVVTRAAWEWVNTGRGARVIQAFADMSSPTKILEATNNRLDVATARLLADASTPEEVRAVVASRLGVDITKKSQFGNVGGRGAPWIGKLPMIGQPLMRQLETSGGQLAGGAGLVTKHGRQVWGQNSAEYGRLGGARSLYRGAFRMAPRTTGGFDMDDLDDRYLQTRAFVDGARMMDDGMRDRLDQLNRAKNEAEAWNILYGENETDPTNSILGQVELRLVDEFGLPKTMASKLTRAFAGGLNTAERHYANSSLGPTAYGAKEGEVGKALMVGEMMTRSAMLPNYRTMRRATGIMSKIYKLPDPAKAEFLPNAAQGITSAWRNFVLIRGGYVLREFGEMAFAMSLAGGEGMFTHPFQFAANAMNTAAALNVTTWPAKIFRQAMMLPVRGGRLIVDRAGRIKVALGSKATRESLDAHMKELASLGGDDYVDPFTRAVRAVAADHETNHGQFRDLTREEIFEVAKLIDKEALADWVLTQQGLMGLMPHFDPHWARINGMGLFDEINQMGEQGGARLRLAAGQEEMNMGRGATQVDEPIAREATRLTREVHRDELATRKEYIESFITTRLFPLSQDPLMRRLADPDLPFEDIFQEWHKSKLQELQRTMRPELFDPVASGLGSTEDAARDYLEGYARNLQLVTGDDPVLLDAILHRSHDGAPLTTKNKALRQHIESLLDDDDVRPNLPPTQQYVPYGGTLAGPGRRLVNWFFDMSGEFGDIFTRGPYLRQAYAQRVIDLAPHMTYEAKANAVRNLRQAGDLKLARKVNKVKTKKGATLGIDEVETVAQSYARDQMRRAFYNAHRRQNWALAFRIIGPFAQSAMNTFKRWGMYSAQHPQMLYRTLKPIQALTEPGSAAVYEALGALTGNEDFQALYTPGYPDRSVDGFFFHNEYGDRMFAYPAMGNLASLLPFVDQPEGGIHMIAVAPWQNLNVAGISFNPGTGPLFNFNAAMFANERYFQDDAVGSVMRAILPYGLPQDDNMLVRGVRSFLPAYVNRLFSTEDQQGTLQINILNNLLGTGDYRADSAQDMRRATADAKGLAQWFTNIQALGSMMSPATFSWEGLIKTHPVKIGADGVLEDNGVGHLMLSSILADEYKKYTMPQSDQTAWEDYKSGQYQFLLDYGPQALLSQLPTTETMGDGPVTNISESVWRFRSDNPETYTSFRDTIGLFFPGGDPDQEFTKEMENMYSWQKATGERYVPKAEDWLKKAYSTIGWSIYGVKNAELMTTVKDPELQTAMRAELQDNIREQFPGWNPEMRTEDFEGTIDELKEAVNDEDIQGLPGTPFIDNYLQARDVAVEQVRARGGSGDLSTQEAAPIRAQLFTYAASLVRRDTSGTFAYAWSKFFEREFEE